MAIVSFVGVTAAENPRLAVVDMQKLFKEYYRTTEAQKRYNMEYAMIQKGFNEQIEAINPMSLLLEKLQNQIQSDTLTDEQKSKKAADMRLVNQERRMMRDRAKQFEAEERDRVGKLMMASVKGIMREIRAKVVTHGEREGYDFVFDKSGKNSNQVSYFIYLKDAEDITEQILQELNEFAPNAADK